MNPNKPSMHDDYTLTTVDPNWLQDRIKPRRHIALSPELCILCRACEDVCPWDCIYMLYHLHPVKVKRHGLKLTYTFCLGGLSFFLFILLTITGIFLMFFYRPTAGLGQELAYNDMQSLSTTVFFGQLMRNMHRWAAHLMVFTVFLHMARVFYHGAYKPP